jgi:hypothetical protein
VTVGDQAFVVTVFEASVVLPLVSVTRYDVALAETSHEAETS